MKALLVILVFPFLVNASPMQQMDQRIKVYTESNVRCEEGSKQSDEGLFIDVSCDFQCKDLVPKVERVKGTFIPKNLGLTPGNGSNQENTMWSALGISLKIWSQRICFEKAIEGCKSLNDIDSFGIKELQSGRWTMNHFPGCHEKNIIISPFGDNAGSIRLPSIAGLISSPEIPSHVEFEQNGIKLPYATEVTGAECKKPIKAKLCFGDCLDLSQSEIVETISTAEPLGSDAIELCGDQLEAKLLKLKLSPSVRRQFCEAYFWNSYLYIDSMNTRFKTCGALRGDTSCETF